MNPPAALTPIHPIQYASHSTAAVYLTPYPSLVILQAPNTFYLISSADLAKLARVESRGGDNQVYRLKALWPPKDRASPHYNVSKHQQLQRELEEYRVTSMQDLHAAIHTCCHHRLSPFMQRDLANYTPRPVAPIHGTVLSLTLLTSEARVEELSAAGPKSRRHSRLKRVGIKKTACASGVKED